ncbi:MAG: Do family serine endopeptidase [Saprospiraceae bacterium]
MKKMLLLSAATALVVSLTTLGVAWKINGSSNKTLKIEHINSTPSQQTLYTLDEKGEAVPLDFTGTAEKVMESVVHIRSTRTSMANRGQEQYRNLPDPFGDFFNHNNDPFRQFRFQYPQQPNQGNEEPQLEIGTGSGVVINSDGYIVTNNHVVADADDIEVTLHDNRTFKASVIGTDPSTDMALLQIKAKDLRAVPMVNSDDVKVGEWVLAVGNPFNLNSTVTAGIVSAKARNINILKTQYAVESFIQTDAAINPGNSGGALVNLQGGLVGINTAIASPTGSYSGYGFAVPSNIVNKVVEDLLKYGVVQRGVLGVMIRSVDGNLAKDKDLSINAGAYVDSTMVNSAAGSAGIKPGDVILAVDGNEVTSSPELQELIARHSPGDKVDIKVNRKGTEKTYTVVLNNRDGNTDAVTKEQKDALSMLGANFETLDSKTADRLDIAGGIKVKKLLPGKLQRKTQMQEGFIITKVDGQQVTSTEELAKALKHKKGGVMLEGVYEDLPGTYYYAFGIDS